MLRGIINIVRPVGKLSLYLRSVHCDDYKLSNAYLELFIYR